MTGVIAKTEIKKHSPHLSTLVYWFTSNTFHIWLNYLDIKGVIVLFQHNIVAPYDGVVEEVFVSPGSMIDQKGKIMEIIAEEKCKS